MSAHTVILFFLPVLQSHFHIQCTVYWEKHLFSSDFLVRDAYTYTSRVPMQHYQQEHYFMYIFFCVPLTSMILFLNIFGWQRHTSSVYRRKAQKNNYLKILPKTHISWRVFKWEKMVRQCNCWSAHQPTNGSPSLNICIFFPVAINGCVLICVSVVLKLMRCRKFLRALRE